MAASTGSTSRSSRALCRLRAGPGHVETQVHKHVFEEHRDQRLVLDHEYAFSAFLGHRQGERECGLCCLIDFTQQPLAMVVYAVAGWRWRRWCPCRHDRGQAVLGEAMSLMSPT
jgi:hypothetical protein